MTSALSQAWRGRVIVPFALIISLALSACGQSSDSLDPTAAATNTATVTQEPVETSVSSFSEGSGDVPQWDSPPEMQLEEGVDYQARLVTNKGEIVVDLFESEAPLAVNNFVFLAREGYYENVPFHRVVSGFVIQSGDPTGTGRGGPGYEFQDEPVVGDYERGVLAMANRGPNTNGSQFFITLSDLSGRLPKAYTIFGNVIEGMEAVDEIAAVPVEQGAGGEMSSPTEPVFIESVEILER